jgi:hypothetical protein
MPDYGWGGDVSRGWSNQDSNFSSSGGQRNKFWKPSKQAWKGIISDATALGDAPLSYYPGATQAPTSQYTTRGIQQMGQFARNYDGSPVLNNAIGLANQTLQGAYLNGNPYLDRMYQRGAEGMTSGYLTGAMPHLESRFGGAGRTGSGAYMNALGRSQDALSGGLGDMATSLYGGAYDTERDRQMQAMGMAPGLAKAELALPLAAMEAGIRAGGLEQSEGQRFIDAAMRRHQFEQMEPWTRLGMESNIISQANPVISGSNFWQSGSASQSGNTIGVARGPETPESPSTWVSILTGLLNPAGAMMGG